MWPAQTELTRGSKGGRDGGRPNEGEVLDEQNGTMSSSELQQGEEDRWRMKQTGHEHISQEWSMDRVTVSILALEACVFIVR